MGPAAQMGCESFFAVFIKVLGFWGAAVRLSVKIFVESTC